MATPPSLHGIKAIFFDFMGTCLDWHTSISGALPTNFDAPLRRAFALTCRENFFAYLQDCHAAHQPPPLDIDVLHRAIFQRTWRSWHTPPLGELVEEDADRFVQAWHVMHAWPDVAPALAAMRDRGYEVFVLANGTTRLQLDLVRSSGLGHFDMLFSSELLGLSKPDSEVYRKAMQLVGVNPEESLMVAAHAYDLRAARGAGMRTVYVRRWSEDTREDMETVERDVDVFVGGLGDGLGEDGSMREVLDLLPGVDGRKEEI